MATEFAKDEKKEKDALEKWVIYAIDNDYDEDYLPLAHFMGSRSEAREYAYSLLYGKLLEEELPENIEYVSARNGGDTGMEVWSIQRDDSHMTCYIEPYTTPVWCTISDMSTEGREFAEAYPRGLDEGEVGEFFENNM